MDYYRRLDNERRGLNRGGYPGPSALNTITPPIRYDNRNDGTISGWERKYNQLLDDYEGYRVRIEEQ